MGGDLFVNLLDGFGTVLQPQYLVYGALGVLIGTFVGVLPGVGPPLTIALLLPLTYTFEPTAAFLVFGGIYFGALYGGSITSVLMNTPGESSQVVTAIEGYAMAKSGRAGVALSISIIGAVIAGTIATLGLTFLSPVLVEVASQLRATDYFALMVFAFASVTALVGHSLVRGMLSLFIGLWAGLIGIDFVSGDARFTFGIAQLSDGIDEVLVVIGLFAVAEALYGAARTLAGGDTVVPLTGRFWPNRGELRRVWKPWLRGSGLGFTFGALPSGGAEIPTFLSYGLEKRLSKNKKEFGKGAPEGMAGPEAAASASFSGVMVPLLTLGIPTSATAAIMLSAFQIYNIQPGPRLFESSGTIVWPLIASFYIGNILLFVINIPMIRLWVKILKIPAPFLFSGILVFATLGVYSIRNSYIDLLMVYAIGAIGLLMRRYDFPIAPAILGVILGPLVETQFRRALELGDGDFLVFLQRPFSAIVLGLAAVMIVLPLVSRRFGRARDAVDDGDVDAAGLAPSEPSATSDTK
ncbi:tripartite tricarboxylate transporter permease [Jiangella mangrovi]|uniref:Putative tricarboxylic transport membrane protein n=1 Tax=Jiangella mangrovi TaxID=1524084 RepID=A0A7W9LIX6_9ACTN|nr:tripartite tricarboxylate transporter permease [Jiangella mangrovi]MBB5785501.1 putative tricarboxylic transport membrane protein [Jiangella mangrovi]